MPRGKAGNRWRQGLGGRRRTAAEIASALGGRVPWRTRKAHQISYHSNTADPGGRTSNAITMHVTYPVPITVIPPANGYYSMFAVGPYIWMSNNTTGNAFQLIYYGVGNNTTCLQFTSNTLDSNTGYVGNGEIRVSQSSGVLIHDIDHMGNQWIFTPNALANAAHLDINNAPEIMDTAVVYYANSTPAGLGPNVALTGSGSQTLHKRHGGSDGPINDWTISSAFDNQSPPHGYLWVANGIGTSGVSNNLNWATNNANHAANNLLLYVYRCNTSFNPTYNSTGIPGSTDYGVGGGQPGDGGGYSGPNGAIGEFTTTWTGVSTAGQWTQDAYDSYWSPTTGPSGWYRIHTANAMNSDPIFGPNAVGAMWNTSGNATVSNTVI